MGYPRFMRRRGYGVHSPFAYRLITDVIGEKCAYYDYARLPGETDKLLYRIAVALQPAEIKELDGTSAAAARLACQHKYKKARVPAKWVEMPQTRLIVTTGNDLQKIESFAREGAAMLVHCNHYTLGLIRRAGLPGITIIMHRECLALIFPFPHLPSQTISI